MKKTLYALCLSGFALLLNGCVTRTYTEEPEHRGARSSSKQYGSESNTKIKGTKRVWVWQDEFRNP